MPLLARKGLLAIAAVIDIAMHRGRPFSARALAARHGVPARHFEPLLQALARRGIVKGVRGARGGYKLGRERSRISADEIAQAAGMDADATLQTPSHVLDLVVMPALAGAERAFAAALARITLDDLVRRAQVALNPPASMSRGLQSSSHSDRAATVCPACAGAEAGIRRRVETMAILESDGLASVTHARDGANSPVRDWRAMVSSTALTNPVSSLSTKALATSTYSETTTRAGTSLR